MIYLSIYKVASIGSYVQKTKQKKRFRIRAYNTG